MLDRACKEHQQAQGAADSSKVFSAEFVGVLPEIGKGDQGEDRSEEA